MNINIFDYLKETANVSLTPQQLQAAQTIEGPVLLLAVPGAGKTTVMVARIANMIFHHQIDPGAILTITFSKAGAMDMRRRYEALFSSLSEKYHREIPSFSTIHAFCYRVLGSYCKLTGGTAPSLIESRDRTLILRELYGQIAGEFLTEDLEEELLSNLSFIKNAMLREEDVKEGKCIETQIKHLWEIYRQYSQIKRQNGWMDFDDMLSYTLTIFRKCPEILSHYQQTFRYLCVDEAQDTSKLQYAILYLLTRQTQNLFLVGDEDQSIYRFRGACPENLLEFPKRFPNATVLKMEENFRSTKEIVSHANRFIALNKQRFEKQMFTKNEQGSPIELKVLHDFSDQYHAAIDAYLKETGTTAILYRNNLSAIPMVDILERNDVDFYIREHKARFKQNYVVLDVIAFFALSFDPSDFEAFSRICYKTSGRIRRSMLEQISRAPLLNGETYFDRVIDLCEENQNTGRIRYVSAMIARLRQMHPAKAMDTILHQLGYLDYLEFSSGNAYSMQAQKLGILTSLASRVSTVEQFLDRIDELDEVIAQHTQRTDSRLTLTTVHSAKGLEFDTVILLDCIDDVFPCHSAIEKYKTGQEEEMEEEARLFYVACTRAKKVLVLPYANYSGNNPALPSRFFSRLLEDPQKDSSGEADVGNIRLYPGLMIEHKNFGRGQVVGVDRKKGVFTVFFGKNGTRTLTMAILKSDTIKKAMP